MSVPELTVVGLICMVVLLLVIIFLIMDLRKTLRVVLLKSRLELYAQTQKELEIMRKHIGKKDPDGVL